MSVVNNNLLLAAEDGGYVIDRSVRLRSSASAYFSRTPATTSSQTTWTWSAWVKRGVLSQQQTLFAAANAGDPYLQLVYDSSTNCLDFLYYVAGVVGRKQTTPVYRDPSSWYHVLVNWDTTNATASDRMRIYVNGTRVESFSISTDPAQNTTGTVNSNSYGHSIGRLFSTTNLFDGYLTEVNFIDGQALTPTSFGEYNVTTGVWQPKKYAGTYGTNGFYLNFSDPASTTTIGADSSGNGNNWTSNNISVTAGVTYDSMIDTPTPVEDERGNFAVLNPLLSTGGTLANGNLSLTSGLNGSSAMSSFVMTQGKWYAEFTNIVGYVGVQEFSVVPAWSNTSISITSSKGIGYWWGGLIYWDGGSSTSAASFSTSDIIGVAVDKDVGTVAFYKNNVLQNTLTLGSGTVPQINELVFVHNGGGAGGSGRTLTANFGQRPFAYTPPSGFKALHTGNLPEPTIVDGGEYFNAVLYTGTGSARSVTGVGFSPDLVWIKSRSSASSHEIYDSVRGATQYLSSNQTIAEISGVSGVTSFDTDGFTIGSSTSVSGRSDVAWNWKANGAGVSNTDGSITSTVSAGVTQGFSVVTHTGNGSSATIGHGLGVAPSMILYKRRDSTGDWNVYHRSIGKDRNIILNSTDADYASTTWNNTAPTSTVYSIVAGANSSSATYVAYCFAEVPGFSKFGSYTGNGSADGPFVFCGFRPAYVLTKRSDSTSSWYLRDTSRSPYNAATEQLYPDLANAEANETGMDILSNGFKQRGTSSGFNTNGGTYIFMAFAENPFKYSLAR